MKKTPPMAEEEKIMTQRYIDRIRQEFPHLENQVYFDIASVAIPPLCVQKAVESYVQESIIKNLGKDTVKKGQEQAKILRERIARLIGGQPEGIAFCSSTAQGLSLLSCGFPWKEGDNLITTDTENFANLYQWKELERKGIECRLVKTRNGVYGPSDVEALMDSRTRLVTVSSIGFESGFRPNLKEIGEICRKRNAFFCVDGIQSLGRFPMDVESMNIDFVAAAGYKSLQAVHGIAFIYCSSQLLKLVSPQFISKLSVKNIVWPDEIENKNLVVKDTAEKFENGNLNYCGISCLLAAVDFLLELGDEERQNHVLGMEAMLRNRLTDLKILTWNKDWKRENWSGCLVFHFPVSARELVQTMAEEIGIRLSLKRDYMRLSIGIHNSIEDILKAGEFIHAVDRALWRQ